MKPEMDFDDFKQILSHDKTIILFRTEWAAALKQDPIAALLLQQIYYLYLSNEEFYKFRQPCKHGLYRTGDSWTETLQVTNKVFDRALSKIAKKLTKEDWDSGSAQHDKLVEYRTDINRVTWYRVHEKNMEAWLRGIYVKSESAFTETTGNNVIPYSGITKVPNTELAYREDKTEKEDKKQNKGTVDLPAPCDSLEDIFGEVESEQIFEETEGNPSSPDIPEKERTPTLTFTEHGWAGDSLTEEIVDVCKLSGVFQSEPTCRLYPYAVDTCTEVVNYVLNEQCLWWADKTRPSPEKLYETVRTYLISRYTDPNHQKYLYDHISLEIQKGLGISLMRNKWKSEKMAMRAILGTAMALFREGLTIQDYIKWFLEELKDKPHLRLSTSLFLSEGMISAYLGFCKLDETSYGHSPYTG